MNSSKSYLHKPDPSFTTSFPETIDDLQLLLWEIHSPAYHKPLMWFVLEHKVWSHYCQGERNMSKILQYYLWGMTAMVLNAK